MNLGAPEIKITQQQIDPNDQDTQTYVVYLGYGHDRYVRITSDTTRYGHWRWEKLGINSIDFKVLGFKGEFKKKAQSPNDFKLGKQIRLVAINMTYSIFGRLRSDT